MALPRISFGGKSYDPRPPKKPVGKAKPRPIFGGLGQQWGAGSAPGVTPAVQPPAASKPYVAPGPDESWKDQTYFDTTAGVSKGLDNLKGYLTNSAKGIGSDYGIDYKLDGTDANNPLKLAQIGTNPDGSPKYMDIADNVDVTNPFSRAALLKKSYRQATAGNTNSMAARGQLYSGALQNAQNATGQQNLQAQDSLIKDFSGRFGDLYGQWLGGNTDAGAQTIGAQTAATDRHMNDPVVPPSTRDIASDPKSLAAAGITVGVEGGKIVVKDSQGKVIPGATIHVQGKKRFVRVPRGA